MTAFYYFYYDFLPWITVKGKIPATLNNFNFLLNDLIKFGMVIIMSRRAVITTGTCKIIYCHHHIYLVIRLYCISLP